MLMNHIYHIGFKSLLPDYNDIKKYISNKTGVKIYFSYTEKDDIGVLSLYRKKRSRLDLIFFYKKKKMCIEPRHSFKERYLYLTSLEAIQYFGGNVALTHPKCIRRKWNEINPLIRLFIGP
jgi:hypothetical protein